MNFKHLAIPVAGFAVIATAAFAVMRSDPLPSRDQISQVITDGPISDSIDAPQRNSPTSVIDSVSVAYGAETISERSEERLRRTSSPKRTAEISFAKGLDFASLPVAEEERLVLARNLTVDHADAVPALLSDSVPDVRIAALDRINQLEVDYEAQYRIERQPEDPGYFASDVIAAIEGEVDPFALAQGLRYLGEYGGTNSQARETLVRLLDREDLQVPVLAAIAEQLIESQHVQPEETLSLVLNSPSAVGLSRDLWNELEGAVQGLVVAELDAIEDSSVLDDASAK